MATSLLALLDDIATVLDDVAAMTKVTAGRTAGVLGDDLALNAEQVSGVRASRELPVVWAVFKGSARNKLILVPTALLLAAFAPSLIQALLMLGGAYLCFEGFEKVAGRLLHHDDDQPTSEDVSAALRNPAIDMAAFEREKIKGAIRTDFVLSAEIIVISLGTVQAADFITQVLTIITIAVLMTFGVYGLVAGIVRLDDVGLRLSKSERAAGKWLGYRILEAAPYLMKGLTIVGTAAMFLVGGGIFVHGIAPLHHLAESAMAIAGSVEIAAALVTILASMVINGVTGLFVGGMLVPVVSGTKKLFRLIGTQNKDTE